MDLEVAPNICPVAIAVATAGLDHTRSVYSCPNSGVQGHKGKVGKRAIKWT